VIAAHSLESLQQHLAEVLGDGVALDDAGLQGLPLALRSQYRAATADLLGQHCTFLVRSKVGDLSAEIIAKHLAVVREKLPGPLVMVAQRITPHLRRRLIAERIPFVIPGTQLYLPFLGMLFTERFPAVKPTAEALRPAAQAAILWWIHHGFVGGDTARLLAPRLGYTPMSLSRVFDELERFAKQAPALVIERIGRERKVRWTGNARELWLAMRPFMRDPVIRRTVVAVTGATPGLPAGLSGLAVLGDVTAPDPQVVAIERARWSAFIAQQQPRVAERGEPDAVQVEVWRYAPDLHREHAEQTVATADPLSIAVSMANYTDERVEAALAHLIAEHPWRW
jgi:hypothetical protein